MSDKEKAGPTLGADTADLFTALVNIWLALEAIKVILPEPQARSVSLAVDGLANVMGSLMKRHNIEVSDVVATEAGHE
jgi:hypothetical protein